MILKDLINSHLIPVAQLAAAVAQDNGRPMTRPAMSAVVNHGVFPKTSDPKAVWKRMHEYLAGRGVPGEALNEVKTALFGDGAEIDNHEDKITVSKPILTQAALRWLQISEYDPGPFERGVHGSNDVFFSDGMRYAQESMDSAVRHGGFLALITEPGGGKSTLAHDLYDRMMADEKGKIVFIYPDTVAVEKITASSIFEAIIDDVSDGQERPRRTYEGRSRQARQILSESQIDGRKHVLMIEDAQSLHPSTLRALKRFWELKKGHASLLSIVLVAQTELGAILDQTIPSSYSLREVAMRCSVIRIPPLSTEELASYLRHKFERAGLNADHFFEPSTYPAMHQRLHQDGENLAYPQRVNNLAVRAINKLAEMGGYEKIPAALVEGDLRLRGELI